MPATAKASNNAAKRLSARSERSRAARSPGYSKATLPGCLARMVRPMSVALSCALRGFDPLRHGLPVDIAEESIDVLGRRGTKVHLIRVLVHVHHQQRPRR